jgi:hypothetical protein
MRLCAAWCPKPRSDLRLGWPRLQLRKQQFMQLLRSVDDLGRALEEDGPAAPAAPSSAAPMQLDA